MKYNISKHASQGGKASFKKLGRKGMKLIGRKGLAKRWGKKKVLAQLSV